MKLLAQIAFVLLAAIIVHSFVRTAMDGEQRRACTPLCALSPAYVGNDRMAPNFELADVDGQRVRLSDYRGKPVVLSFWSETCESCKEEMPALAELSARLRAQGSAELITICTDEDPRRAKELVRSIVGRDPPFRTLMDPGAEVVGGKFGTKAYPETWLIDARGIIHARYDGPRRWNEPLASNVVEMLRSPARCAVRRDKESAHRLTGPSAELCAQLSGS